MLNRLNKHYITVLLLMAATFAVYAQSLGHEFLSTWDDGSYVVDNDVVRGFTLEHLKAAFTSYYVGNYAPLHIISYMLDHSVWGMRPAGFIFTNILIHALNGVLYYILLTRLAGRRIWAFTASFIFLLHPVQVESVVWISQRKNVLAMFFFLISFLLYINYRETDFGIRGSEKGPQNSKSRIQNSKFMYAGSVVAFILALLAKSVVVILPPVLMLYDFCFMERHGWRKRLVDKIPYIAAAAIVALVAVESQAPGGGGGRTGYHGGSPLATFFTMLPVFASYLGMLFWPTDLSAAYNPSIKTGIDGIVGLSALVLLLLCGGGFYLYRRRRDLFFWGVFFFAGLLPVSQIVPLVTLMNDRYLYFPMLGGAAFIVGAAVSLLDSLTGTLRKGAVAAACLLLLPLPFLTFNRVEVWQDSLSLWTDAYGKVPDSALVCSALGTVYEKAGKHDVALRFYQRALSLAPLNRNILQDISVIYLEAGEPAKGWPYLQKLVENYPDFAEGLVTLGNYHFEAGNLPQAETAYRRALLLTPGSGALSRNLGLLYFKMKNFDSARDYYQKALAAGGAKPEIYYELACLESVSGRPDKGLYYLEEAFKLGFIKMDAVSKDPDLDTLRPLPEFRRLLVKYMGGEG